MSLMNYNNATNDSSKNDLLNSYKAIKNGNIDKSLNEYLPFNKTIFKNKFLLREINKSNEFSKTPDYFHRNIAKFNSKPNSTSFCIISNSLKNKIIYNNKYSKKTVSSKIKNLKQKLLSIKAKSITKDPYRKYLSSEEKQRVNYNIKKNMEIKKLNSNLLYNKININNSNSNSKNNNETKSKELQFKVFNRIKNNYEQLCNHFITNAESINKKITEYYSSNNFKKIYKSYKAHFHYKKNVETNPKIKTYVDIPKINEQSLFTKKINLDQLFTPKEKKIILLDPDYYFKNTHIDCLDNVNIIKSNTLAGRINLEDTKEQEELERKKRKRTYTINSYNTNEKKNILNKKEIKNRNNDQYFYRTFVEEYIEQYEDNIKNMENIIKKENEIQKEKDKIHIQNEVRKAIDSGYYRYKNLINKKNKINTSLKPMIINKTSLLETKNSLLLKNYKNIIKDELKINKINKLSNEGINFKKLNASDKHSNKGDLNNLSKSKQMEYIKTYVNKIKRIYNKTG